MVCTSNTKRIRNCYKPLLIYESHLKLKKTCLWFGWFLVSRRRRGNWRKIWEEVEEYYYICKNWTPTPPPPLTRPPPPARWGRPSAATPPADGGESRRNAPIAPLSLPIPHRMRWEWEREREVVVVVSWWEVFLDTSHHDPRTETQGRRTITILNNCKV